jgi:hypothetical protein
MPSIKFKHNWNQKLNCNSFTTIRLHDDSKYSVGLNYTIRHGHRNCGVAKLVEKRVLRLDQLNEFVAQIDAGVSLKEFIAMIKNFYDSKNIDWRTQPLDLLLMVKVGDKGKQKELFNLK